MSTENPVHGSSDPSPKPVASSNVATLFAPTRSEQKQVGSSAPDSRMAQPDPLKELVNSLERRDSHFQDNIRDVERQLTGMTDKVRKHEELFPVVNQNFQSMQISLKSHTDRLSQHMARLDAQESELVSVEATMTEIAKDIAALRVDIDAVRWRRTWTTWMAAVALVGVLVSAAIQLGLLDVATALSRLIAFG